MDVPMVTTTAPEAPAGTGARRVLGMPVSAVRQVRRSAATTPGRLSVIALGLIVLTLVTGAIGALAMQEKQDTINDLIDHREPLAAAAQQLYRSLSDADATAASAFLSGGAEPAALRDRYEIDIAQAGAALAKSAADVGGDAQAQAQVQQLNQQLPIYTALVETARTNNRQGFPAGAAYLREASALMGSKILPAAEQLYLLDFRRLSDEQDAARSFPWVTVALVLVLLAALIAAQLYLTRKTNRLLNVGLLVATVAVVLALAWGAVALFIGSSRIGDGQRTGSQQVEMLVSARIVSLKARAAETLTLVARGDGPEYQEEFERLAPQISGDGEQNLLQQARNRASGEQAEEIQAATDNANAWMAAHQRIRKLDDGGQYEEAVTIAIGDAQDSAATVFARLDENMITALNAGRKEFLDQTLGARAALTALVPGIAVLALVAAAGITMGISTRLREYR